MGFFSKLFGGGSSTVVTQANNQDINFSPTTEIDVNFDTEGLSNAYLDGSQNIANSYTDSTQALINFQRSVEENNLNQNQLYFNSTYEQNEFLANNQINNDNNNLNKELALKGAEMQIEAIQFNEMLNLNKAQQKTTVTIFIIGLVAYLYTKRKNKK